VLASLAIGDVVLSFAALSFLGIGTAVGYADWGQVLSFARNWISSLTTYWYIIIWPGLTLVLFVLGWNLVGDALRDVLDPRMRGKLNQLFRAPDYPVIAKDLPVPSWSCVVPGDVLVPRVNNFICILDGCNHPRRIGWLNRPCRLGLLKRIVARKYSGYIACPFMEIRDRA